MFEPCVYTRRTIERTRELRCVCVCVGGHMLTCAAQTQTTAFLVVGIRRSHRIIAYLCSRVCCARAHWMANYTARVCVCVRANIARDDVCVETSG